MIHRGMLAAGLLCAVLASVSALAHDEASAPHLRCVLDGSDTLICLYTRHATGPMRKSRAGYADRGHYELSCVGSTDDRVFRMAICPAGTGTTTAFQCWTQDRRTDWLNTNDANDAATREDVTSVHRLPGLGIQETLLKLLVDPARVGRPNFLEGGALGASMTDVRAYASTCGIGTRGALTAQDVVNLLPALAVFGRLDRE